MLNDPNCRISDLVGDEKLMELGEVWVSLEYIEEVESHFQGLLVVVSESTRDSAHEGVMFQHKLHILIGETEEEQTHSTLYLLLNLILIKLL